MFSSRVNGMGDGLAPGGRGTAGHKKGLAKKLTCCVVTVIASGVLLIMALQVVLTLTNVPDWGDDAKKAMIALERENLQKLAADKAEYVAAVFGRLKQDLLQLQAFTEQVLLTSPERIAVDGYLEVFSGLNITEETWNNSCWFIPGITTPEEFPTAGSLLGGLLNRSALTDAAFRSFQRQEELMYLASLSYPTTESSVDFQSYPGNDTERYTDWGTGQICDARFDDLEDYYDPDTYDPRCRRWYQDAIASGTRDVIFTNPYKSVTNGALTVTPAAPVYNTTGQLLGVVGIDMDFAAIEDSILNLRVVEDEGYAYVLAPGSDGEVAVHRDLDPLGDAQRILSLETDVDHTEFRALVEKMNAQCSGLAAYMKNEVDMWLLSWEHENASASTNGCEGGFIIVVTVQEDVLLKVFTRMEQLMQRVVIVASVVMAVLVAAILCVASFFAHAVSERITKPVNQLIDVVRALNRLDFSHQEIGTWMVNGESSAEVKELTQAFQGMKTVVAFANVMLCDGNIDVARTQYEAARILFKKLDNARGVSIVDNNIGNACTLQARKWDAMAATPSNLVSAAEYRQKADEAYSHAVTAYQLAIDDAYMLCTVFDQKQNRRVPNDGGDGSSDEGTSTMAPKKPLDLAQEARDLEAATIVGDRGHHVDNVEDLSSARALKLQLMNRMFNLALCLAAKGGRDAEGGQHESRDPTAINDARRLMWECVEMAAERQDAVGDERQVEYLIAIAALERDRVPSRHAEMTEALDQADRLIAGNHRDSTNGTNVGITPARTVHDHEHTELVPTCVLRQRVLFARGEQCIASGNSVAGISHFDQAVVGCGDRMDVAVVRKSLTALKTQALAGLGKHFSPALLRGLGMPPHNGVAVAGETLAMAIDKAIPMLDRLGRAVTKIDLCFVMDCTRSMQKWIDQAKTKLFDIVAQARREEANLELRVAYVGYRDYGDRRRYEGPYDFHTEEELPDLMEKLQDIRADGGGDVPEDMAGGLHHAVALSWRSPIRLCMLIADAPCHGAIYHGVCDNYPDGCPMGRDPAKLLYTLQYELGVDFYFIRITSITDKMVGVLRSQLDQFADNRSNPMRPSLPDTSRRIPKFIELRLGSYDNPFVAAVVKSVNESAGMNLRYEDYC